MVKSLCLILVIFIAFSEPAFGWRHFWKGRRFEGNVGHPTEFRGKLKSENNDDLSFTQKLDHSDPMNDKTWDQRYFVNDEFFSSNDGPVFIMIGGEGEATAKWMSKF